MRKRFNRVVLITARLATSLVVLSFLTVGVRTLAQTQQETLDRASREEPLPMDELMTRADTVVYGKVIDVESGWNELKTVIYTTVTIEVERTVKGDPRSTLSFKLLGGQVGNLRTVVSHLPTFSTGEEVLLFLNFKKAGAFSPLINGDQGKYIVQKDDKQEARYVNARFVGMPIFSATTGRLIELGSFTSAKRIPLTDVLYSLRRQRTSGATRVKTGGISQ